MCVKSCQITADLLTLEAETPLVVSLPSTNPI